MTRFLPLLLVLLATACGPVVVRPAPTQQGQTAQRAPQSQAQVRTRAETAARNFIQVVDAVEPVAEAECRRRAPGAKCDFQIVVDDRPNQAPNAFQTVDKSGRPIIAFNLGLIASARNADELAFVMGHEASHHILRHLDRMRTNATAGAVIFSGVASISGASAQGVKTAQELGATIGARSYSKEFELEADRLGTIITARSGYNPLRGAEFFTRIPDPGNRFLGSHPPNAARIDTVRRTVAGM